MISDVTPLLGLQLPHPENELADDVTRLRAALNSVDSILSGKIGHTELDAALAELVDGAPEALDQIRELAAAIGNDPDFAAHVAAQLVTLQNGLAGVLTTLAGKADAASVAETVAAETAARTAADSTIAGQITGLTSSTKMKSYFNFGD